MKPVVSSIESRAVSSNQIVVAWKLPENSKSYSICSLLIYKNTRPIALKDALRDLKPVAELPANAVSYSDTVTDFREYYYAVVSVVTQGNFSTSQELFYDEELDVLPETAQGEVYDFILPGVNATVTGTRVKSPVSNNSVTKKTTESAKERIYRNDELREQPLPFLDILGSANSSEHKISSKAERACLELVGGKQTHKEAQPLEVYYFEEDLISPAGGDEYLLFVVLKDSFVNKKYEASISDLEKYLSQNRNEKCSSRAVFYLGESYYFTGNFRNAITEFLKINELYPSLANKWIESCLEFLE